MRDTCCKLESGVAYPFRGLKGWDALRLARISEQINGALEGMILELFSAIFLAALPQIELPGGLSP